MDRFRRRRDSRAVLTAGAGLTVQAADHAIGLLIVPLSVQLLGAEQYGLWLAVGSLVAWGGVTDFGLAPGLVNLVAAASGRGDRAAMKRYVSTGLWAYAALATIVLLAVAVAVRWAPLPVLLGAGDGHLAASARLLVAFCGTVFAAFTVTRIVLAVFTALQQGYYPAWAHLVGKLLSLAVLLLLVPWEGSLLAYAGAMVLPPLVVQVGLGALLFRRNADLRPDLRSWDVDSLRAMGNASGFLALHQAANLAILYSANVLIASRLGAAMVPHYSVPYALFSVVRSAAWLIVSPYIAALSEASARADWEWIRRRAHHALLATAGVAAGGCGALVLAGPEIVSFWIRGAVRPEASLLAVLGAFCFLHSLGNTTHALLIGVGLVRAAALGWLVVAAFYVAGTCLLLPWVGLAGVPAAGAAAHLLGLGILTPCVVRHLRTKGSSSSEIDRERGRPEDG